MERHHHQVAVAPIRVVGAFPDVRRTLMACLEEALPGAQVMRFGFGHDVSLNFLYFDDVYISIDFSLGAPASLRWDDSDTTIRSITIKPDAYVVQDDELSPRQRQDAERLVAQVMELITQVMVERGLLPANGRETLGA